MRQEGAYCQNSQDGKATLRPTIASVVRFSGFLVGALAAASASAQAQLYFSPEERDAVLKAWAEQGRYSVSLLPDAPQKGSWRVRLTPDGSAWLLRYTRLLQDQKFNPAVDAKGDTPQERAWEDWVKRKVDYDNWAAEKEAAENNAKELGAAAPAPPAAPPAPGPLPSSLRAALMAAGPDLAPEPPAMAAAVQPKQHTVRFGDMALAYQDHIPIRRTFAYFRFNEGVQSFGERVRSMNERELSAMFRDAGLSETDMRVMRAVSLLEGGFDSINTYDTGFVSAGFIQFAALRGGAGSLGRVLLEFKRRTPQAFDRAFRSHGLEVTPAGELVALCPTSGVEFIGPAAAMKIISDKRLAAVFQFAGRASREYRVAQLVVAKSMYHPANDTIRVAWDGRSQLVRVGDVFRSEAGIATLMDRKVNTGRLGNLEQIASAMASQAGIDRADDLRQFEYDLVRRMKYRKDYMTDDSLSRPKDQTVDASRLRPDPPSRSASRRNPRATAARTTASRSGSRAGRKSSAIQAKQPAKRSSRSR